MIDKLWVVSGVIGGFAFYGVCRLLKELDDALAELSLGAGMGMGDEC